ncbi:hypothetical protein FZEAL_316 [Fusarium zealandicum]|uniref:Uncharacterized protein n=1 Tax=Fusarium zealandicum TaxID=1053134 RepID=A0A8H4UVL0_9HYPO|nr:hypothetical protein FZEAL_316 [Fusarium zealandicum]
MPTAKLIATQLSSLATLATSRQDVPFPLSSKLHDIKVTAKYVEPSPPDSPISDKKAEDEDTQSLLELMLEYADQVVEIILQSSYENTDAHRELLRLLIDYVENAVLATRNIHTVVSSFPVPDSQRSNLLRSYYEALHAADVSPCPQKNGLFGMTCRPKGAPTTIYTVFGGQGLRSDCVTELHELITTYPSLTTDLIHDSTLLIATLARTDATASQVLPQGFNILAWLQDPAQVPDSRYLASAPISAPLIGLVQLAHYEVTCKTLGLTPGQFRSRIAGTTGHSQGIMTAAATAVADDWPSWREASRAALTTLFWIGVRTQQAWKALQRNNAMSEAMVQDSIDHGERTPSPMLSVRGLAREDLQTCVDATRRYLKDGGRCLAISMTNGPRHFVVSGPPKYLYGLNLQIRKTKQLLVQQSSAGKAENIASSFLDVSVPFHTDWLDQAMPMIQNDLQHVRLPSSGSAIPVFSTEDGRDIGCQGDQANVLPKLVELVVRRGVDWGKATGYLYADVPEPTVATQTVLDFGPGGVDGISSLSASSGGSRIILAGTLSGRKADVGYKGDLFEL